MNTKMKIGIVLFLLIISITSMTLATDVVFNQKGTANLKDAIEETVETEVEKELREGITTEVKVPVEELEENMKNSVHDNFYKGSAEASYTLNDNVYGNVFLAGNELIINSDYISGDLFVAGNNITIKENTVIDGNVYIAGQEINIEGTLYKSAYLVGKVINIKENATLEYDVFMTGDILEVEGIISRSMYAYTGKLVVDDNASIERNLYYEANEKAEIKDGVVKGKVDFRQIVVEEKTTSEIILEYAIDLFQSLIFTLAVFLVISLMSNKFVYKSQESIGKHLLKSIGIGLFGLVVTPIVIAVLILLNSTAVVGFALIPAFILMIIISNSITAIAIAGMLCARSKGMKLPIVVALIAIGVWAVEALPYIGTLATFFSMLIGLGVLLQNIFNGKKTISKSEEDAK